MSDQTRAAERDCSAHDELQRLRDTLDAGDVAQRLERLEKTMRTLAWWLVQAQTGFGDRDAQGIEDILDGKR
jgi:hypothetical protein